MKGVSPLVASVVTVLIVITLAGGYAAFTGNVAGEQKEAGAEKAKQVTERLDTTFRIQGVDGRDAVLQNTGDQELESNAITVTIDGTPYNHTGGNIQPGEEGRISVEELWEAGPGRKTLEVGGPSFSDSVQIEVIPTDGVRGHWKFEEGEGDRAFDSSNLENHGELVNGPSWTQGRFGGGLDFDGDDDRVDLPVEVLDGRRDVTTAFWIKTTKTGSQAVVSGAYSGNQNEYLIFPSDTDINFYNHGNAVSWTVDSTADGTWHHVTLVRDGTSDEAALYLDGDFQGTKSVTLDELSIDPDGLVLAQEQDSVGGGFDPGQALDGTVDELVIYNRLLEPDQLYEMEEV